MLRVCVVCANRPFMSGMVCLDCLIEYLVAQAFYNPFIMEVLSSCLNL